MSVLDNSLPDKRLQDAGRIRTLDALVQTALCSHKTMPEGHRVLLDVPSGRKVGLDTHREMNSLHQSFSPLKRLCFTASITELTGRITQLLQ